MAHVGRRSALILLVVLLSIATRSGLSDTRADGKSVEDAVLAVHAEMTRAGETVDAERTLRDRPCRIDVTVEGHGSHCAGRVS